MKEGKGPRVTAVHRGLQILELLAGQGKSWGTAEISRRLKIPKSTTSYLLHTLMGRGYLRREADGTYRLSMKLLTLGSLALHGVEMREIAVPILRRLVAETGITGHLAVLEGSEAVFIERVPSPGFLQVDTWVGRRMPLHSTGSGKVLLAFSSPEQVHSLLSAAGLPRSTPQTIVSLPRLKQELRRIRDCGFALDDEENTAGVRCVAAPVFDLSRRVVAVLSLTGAVQQMTDDQLPRMAERLKESGRQMTLALGGSSPALPPQNLWNRPPPKMFDCPVGFCYVSGLSLSRFGDFSSRGRFPEMLVPLPSGLTGEEEDGDQKCFYRNKFFSPRVSESIGKNSPALN